MPRPAAGFPRKNSSQDVRISRRGDERPSALAQKEAFVHQLVGVACHLLHIAGMSAVELLEPLPAEIELITGVRTRVRDDAAWGEARRRDTGTRNIDCDAGCDDDSVGGSPKMPACRPLTWTPTRFVGFSNFSPTRPAGSCASRS